MSHQTCRCMTHACTLPISGLALIRSRRAAQSTLPLTPEFVYSLPSRSSFDRIKKSCASIYKVIAGRRSSGIRNSAETLGYRVTIAKPRNASNELIERQFLYRVYHICKRFIVFLPRSIKSNVPGTPQRSVCSSASLVCRLNVALKHFLSYAR